ncbi:MAG TPA: hypothetical protein VNX28_00820 [Gemmataceae bacterium]|jgi:hypothetical protein|nr:hypothetical protein [Gemmataceae bacterium]
MKNRARWKPCFLPGLPRLLLVMLGLGMHVTAFAQEDQPVPKWYLSKGSLHIPIQIDERARAQVQEVHLYVKEGPKAAWHLKEKVPGTQTFFTFPAGQEGEYWLNLVTVDRAGRAVPADITNEPPRLIVIVDSTPPEAEIQVLSTTLDGTRVRCEIRDANIEPSKTRFFYQTREQEWRLLACVSGQPDLFCIPYGERLTGMIRVVAGDLAGNVMTRELNLAVMTVANNSPSPPPTAPPLAAGANPAGNIDMLPPLPPPSTVARDAPVVISEKVIPFSERIELVANKVRQTPPPQVPGLEQAPLAPPAVPGGSDVQLLPDASAIVNANTEAPAKRHFVNNPHVFLDYQIEQTGGSGVGRVEIWYTRDMSKSWQKLGEDANRKGQAAISLPGEGVYGVTVIASNGRGLGAEPPKPGDSPDWWIEVDTTRPRAELLNVRCDTNGDNLSVHIAWSARDKNLQAEPIDLFYSGNPHGPWLPIAKGIKNDGVYRWTPPVEAGAHAFIRLMARDRAGNTATADSPQAVALDDLSRPRVRLVGVTTVPRIVPGSVATPGPLPASGN